MNWRKIAKYAALLFVVQCVIGFIEGFLAPEVSASVRTHVVSMMGWNLVLFAACAAVFAHLAAHQPLRPYVHAGLVFLVQACGAILFSMVMPDWLRASDPTILVLLAWLVLVCALLAGTGIGRKLQRQASD